VTLESLVVFVLVGIVAGFLAGLVVMGHGRGWFWNLIIGILGALIGGWLFNFLHIPLNLGAAIVNQIVIAFVGAVILLLIWRLLFRRGK
jgi:uncharacterized membrane protein YeaQ/YmgE (transglycosylase-associated protein family)